MVEDVEGKFVVEVGRRLGRTESCRSRSRVNDEWRGCAWRLKLTARLVQRGKDLAEGRGQISKGVLVRT